MARTPRSSRRTRRSPRSLSSAWGAAQPVPTPGDGDSPEPMRLAQTHADAVTLYGARSYSQAVRVFGQVYEGCSTALGVDHDATLTVAGNLAVSLIGAGRTRAGIAFLRRNLADRVRRWGDLDAGTLTARDALAVALRLNGDVHGAVALSTTVTDQRRQVLGRSHLDTLTSVMGLVRALAAAGERNRAIAVLNENVGQAETAHGTHHASVRALVDCGRHLG